MKKTIFILFTILSIVTISSCTKEQLAKKWGGSYTYNLPVNQKLLDVTWKGDDTWILYRPMRENEVAETYIYVQEKGKIISITGDGKITFVESKSKSKSKSE